MYPHFQAQNFQMRQNRPWHNSKNLNFWFLVCSRTPFILRYSNVSETFKVTYWNRGPGKRFKSGRSFDLVLQHLLAQCNPHLKVSEFNFFVRQILISHIFFTWHLWKTLSTGIERPLVYSKVVLINDLKQWWTKALLGDCVWLLIYIIQFELVTVYCL